MTQKNQVGVINVSGQVRLPWFQPFIYFIYQGQNPKMLVMVFNQKNRSFLALIPNDPEGFFTKLKEVYQMKRPAQDSIKQQNPQQPQQQQQNPQQQQQQQNPQLMNQHQMNPNMQRPMVSMPMNTQVQLISRYSF